MGFTCILSTNTFLVGRYWDSELKSYFVRYLAFDIRDCLIKINRNLEPEI